MEYLAALPRLYEEMSYMDKIPTFHSLFTYIRMKRDLPYNLFRINSIFLQSSAEEFCVLK